MITLVPTALIAGLTIVFFVWPTSSNDILSEIRFWFGNTWGSYYLIIGLGIFVLSIFLAMSKYGDIVLGNPNEKPKYSFFSWGCMMFTCGLAADILFYSFSEWMMYAENPHITELGSVQDWVSVYPIFHWSFIPWGFYLVLAVVFAFMLHVRNRDRQRYSEACRPVLKKHTDGWIGRGIDLLAIFALLAGTATTFSIATPLVSSILVDFFHIELNRTIVTICALIVICFVYTYSLLHGFKGIQILAKACIYLFFGLIAFVFLFGGQMGFILDTGVESFGRMIQNFVSLATYTDPNRTTNFPQDWTIYYWAYWMVWCVSAPFFIGSISKGRTIRQVIVGGYLFGVGSTILSFIVLGNYSLGLQTSSQVDFLAKYVGGEDLYELIIDVIHTLPCSPIVLIVVLFTMIAFYATSFDSIAYTAACYSYRNLDKNGPGKGMQLLWCLLLIMFPIALVFSESSMSNLQSVSIIAAFPIGIVMILMIVSFFVDCKKYKIELEKEEES